MKVFIASLTLLLLVGCGGSGSSSTPTTPDVPTPTVPPVDTTQTDTVPTGELVKWAVPVDAAGFEGSATFCDLDNDGKLEGIVPVAVVDGPELSFLMVVEGDTGAVRWQSALGDASYAYPLCVDVNDDGVLDILTGGRTKHLIALNGVDGTDGSTALTNNMSFSSGTPALGDLNGNGVLDILYAETSALTATNGGIVLIEFPGALPPQTNATNSFRGMPLHNGYTP
jgi:hypothetical protein